MPDHTPLPADRTKLQMHRERAVPDQAPQFLRDGLIAHVGIADADGPVVIPMTYHYDASSPGLIYLHGAHHSRLMQVVASGARVCVTVTLTDGLVYSKTALNHSANYRSVVAFCRAAAGQPTIEQSRALFEAMIARYWPGRTVGTDYDVIPVKHLETTSLVALQIEAMSAKTRSGGPNGPGDNDPAVPGTAGVTELRSAC
ncbi:MAG: pyridoxamine 5'-phosphate oxidase family protein [Gemmatimonadota bacterium]|nr:pyridoxamine 5'-phosphate oxidase family protein [Gemmatimonadota bacterium]